MAHMIPPVPKEYDEKSDEGAVFKVLKKLPDDYYVFHSVKATVVENGVIYERELDFVVANAKKGILCIEAKNGSNVSYNGRNWVYSHGNIMSHDGPYNQVATAKRVIISKIRNHPNEKVRNLYGKCKVLHAVFFFRVPEAKFMEMAINGLPEEADPKITLFAEDMINPTKKIAEIFSLKTPYLIKNTVEETKLSEEEFQLLLDTVLCPTFNLVPSPKARDIAMVEQMNQLLREQYRLLDFLEEQSSAVINGAAGTGKTMIAVEKARRNSINGDKVLFLCYNRLLCDYLINTHKRNESKTYRTQFKNVDFMTISKLAKEKTGNYTDFDGLLEWISDCYGDFEKFEYKHVIIDEGQDFGLIDTQLGTNRETAKKNCSIIDTMQEVVLAGGGTFYLFYDKYQMIQGGSSTEYELLDCIQDCDCRLTLHCNCRNTKDIAKTSVTPLKDKKNKAIIPTTASSWFATVKPTMHIIQDDIMAVETVNSILEKYQKEEIDDVVLLTPGLIDFCCLADKIDKVKSAENGYYTYSFKGKIYKVTTCIKFKGLEADAVIMLDLTKDSFTGKKGLEFYVGTSRAKIRLDLVCKLAASEYSDVVRELDSNAPQRNNVDFMRNILAATLSVNIEFERQYQ